MHQNARRNPGIQNSERRRNKTNPRFLMEVRILARTRTRRARRRPNAPTVTKGGIQRVHALTNP